MIGCLDKTSLSCTLADTTASFVLLMKEDQYPEKKCKCKTGKPSQLNQSLTHLDSGRVRNNNLSGAHVN